MDGVIVLGGGLRKAVNGLAYHVEQAAADVRPYGHSDGAAGVANLRPALDAVRRVHGDRANAVLTKVLLDLENERALGAVDLDSEENVRDRAAREVGVDDGADDLRNDSCGDGGRAGGGCSVFHTSCGIAA